MASRFSGRILRRAAISALFVPLICAGRAGAEGEDCAGGPRMCQSGLYEICFKGKWTCLTVVPSGSNCPLGLSPNGTDDQGNLVCLPPCQGVSPCAGATCLGGVWVCPTGTCSGSADCENAVCDGNAWQCPEPDCAGYPPACGSSQFPVCGRGTWGCQDIEAQSPSDQQNASNPGPSADLGGGPSPAET